MTEASDSNPTSQSPRRSDRSKSATTRTRRGRDTSRTPKGVDTRTIIGISVGVLGLIALLLGVDVAVSAGRIHPGVTVGGVEVGGKSIPEAQTLIADHVATRGASPVTVAAGGSTWEITAEQVELSVDATTLAGEAFEIGRGSFASVVGGRARAIFGGVDVPLALRYGPESMDAVLTTIKDAVATPAVNAGVVVEGTTVTRTEPKDGFGIVDDEAAARICSAFLLDSRKAELELTTVPPLVSTDQADAAYEAARTMVSAPVVLFYESHQWEVPAEEIGAWIGFRVTGDGDTAALEAYVVSEEVSATVIPMVAEVGRPAKNASFKAASGKVSIVPAEDGLAADAEDLASKLTPLLSGAGERRAELTMHRVEADVTTAEAQQMGIIERIATFTTEYASSNKPRVNNIHTLADSLNNTLIAPGATFSFNGTIGQRTAEKGYQEANAIVNGKLVPQLGGGICQVGTTIFNTVFFSGLPVVERRNHSQYISHYPKGRDATVSWGGPDFKFKNDTENWVLIVTGYSNSSVTISLYGTDPGYEVDYTTGEWTNIVDPPVREVKDPKLPVGSKVIDERGVSGRTIIVKRTVTKNGQVVRTDNFKSVYRPVEEVVRVGTTPAASKPATSTSP